MTPRSTFLLSDFDMTTVRLIEQASATIGALNSAVLRGFLGACWHDRAMWAGYARALQLQGVEIDEIDVISWACGVPIPGRARFDTLVDPFEGFAGWRSMLQEREQKHWREDLPFSPALPPAFSDAPILLRAIAIVAQHSVAQGGIDPWLTLPLLLQRMGMTKAPLPCLVAGDKAFRLAPRDSEPIIRRTLRDLTQRAADGLAMAEQLEAERRRWIKTLEEERKPGALRTLGAITLAQPVFRPEQLARRLKLTRSGAGKLLDRAAEHGLLLEVSGRRSWRVYMIPDLARRLGFAPAVKGRPVKPPALARADSIGAQLRTFDAEMAELLARYPRLRTPSTEPDVEDAQGRVPGNDMLS